MALSLDISTGQVDLGETKTLQVVCKSDGTAFAPTTLTAVFTPPTEANAVTRNKDDFDVASGHVYTTEVTFSEAGRWNIVVTAVDALGNVEKEKGNVIVHS